MAPVYPYTEEIIVKATRLARYAAAIHGCVPGLTYTGTDGVNRTRLWDGPAGVRVWGGPGINRLPGPECRSCFKDGISFSDDPPLGFQTPVFNLLTSRDTFNDAAHTFLDRTITGVPGRNAIVVLFRATVTSIQAEQWLSNLGTCWAFEEQVPATTNSAFGSVCDGWNKPVDDLINLGLMQDVIRRLNRLPPADRTIYVTGHSRGGALAAVFAAKLIALQAAGGLPAAAGDIRDQIKLYTYGAPRVGNSQFTAYLEDNMLERYRIVNRYDGVPTKPVTNYAHFRPTIWYRDSSGNLTPSPAKGCVMLNQNQLTSDQTSCFISCNSALTCSYGAGANTFDGQPDGSNFNNVNECSDITDNGNLVLSATTIVASSVTLIDHASYLGLDMNNDGCRADLAFINSIRVERRFLLPNRCIPVTA